MRIKRGLGFTLCYNTITKSKHSNSAFGKLNKNIHLPKTSQTTIFIILGVLIVAAGIILFINRQNVTNIFVAEAPADQIRKCLDNPLTEVLPIISKQGGSLEPENYYLFQGDKIDYLCYTEENYKGCVMQKPLLKQDIEDKLIRYIEPRFNNCFNSIKNNLEQNGFQVTNKQPKINVSIKLNSIEVIADLDLTISKESTENFETIKLSKSSGLYDLIMISSSIVNWEARFGNAEIINYLIFYPNLKIEKKKQDESTTIYIMQNTATGEEFTFASRSYAIPPGLIGG